jgi:hypothetical protein
MTAPLKRFTKSDLDAAAASAVAANTRDQLIAELRQRADDSNHLDVRMGERFDTIEDKVDRIGERVKTHQGYFEALGIPDLSADERHAFPKMLRLVLKLDWLTHGIGKMVGGAIAAVMVLAAVLSVISFISHIGH